MCRVSSQLGEGGSRFDMDLHLFQSAVDMERSGGVVSWDSIGRTYPSIHEYPTPSENCSFCLQRIDRGRYGWIEGGRT